MTIHSELPHMRESALRRRITLLNKAIKGGKSHPNGMSGMVIEGCLDDLALIRQELHRRNRAALAHDGKERG